MVFTGHWLYVSECVSMYVCSCSVSAYISNWQNKPQNTHTLIWKQTFIHIYKKKNVSIHERRSAEDSFIPSAKKSFWKNHKSIGTEM